MKGLPQKVAIKASYRPKTFKRCFFLFCLFASFAFTLPAFGTSMVFDEEMISTAIKTLQDIPDTTIDLENHIKQLHNKNGLDDLDDNSFLLWLLEQLNDPTKETIVAREYTLTADETREVTQDLHIIALKKATIAGNLVASQEKGQDITIDCIGNINISGIIQAGNSGDESSGGDIKITSALNGIQIEATSNIIAGDGANGTTTGSAGKDGGSLALESPNGVITVANVPGLIHLGNGGNGTDISIPCPTYAAGELPEEFENLGGNSGGLRIVADRLEGLTNEKQVLTEDLVNPVTDEVIYNAGETIWILEDTDQITGGTAGNSGRILYGVDENGQEVECEEEAIQTAFRTNRGLYSDPIEGRNGAEGFKSGGNGQSIRVKSSNGVHGYYDDGKGGSGQNVNAVGGNGGWCIRTRSAFESILNVIYRTCKPGDGGDAYAFSGNGGDATAPGVMGGDAGTAEAKGGNAGVYYLPGSGETVGKNGDAYAYGGTGGRGGGRCPDNVVDQGGLGGLGGYAIAEGGKTIFPGDTPGKDVARGGNGGSGGDGRYEAGNGGDGGDFFGGWDATNDTVGERGSDGSTCPPATLRVSPPKVTVVTGDQESLKAILTTEAGEQDVTDTYDWTSSDESVATVENGVVTCHGPVNDDTTEVSVDIYCEPCDVCPEDKDQCSDKVTVNCNKRLGYKITPASASTTVGGETISFKAVAKKDGEEHDLTDYSDWSIPENFVADFFDTEGGVVEVECKLPGEGPIVSVFSDYSTDPVMRVEAAAIIICK